MFLCHWFLNFQVGKQIGANIGVMLKNVNDAMCPNEAAWGGWKYWEDHVWVDDPTYSVSCAGE